VPIKIGSRIFAPRVFTTLMTIAVMALLLSLGRWQLRRADDKRVLFDSFAAGTDTTQQIDLKTVAVPRYRHIEAEGHYDSARQVLIDNMVNNDRAGYFVITPFALAGGGWLLVNRGWVPLGESRAERPAIGVSEEARRVHGRADHLPSPGIQLGARQTLKAPYPVVAAFPSHDELAQLLKISSWTRATDLVLLDPDEPDGYVRTWTPPGFPPMRHIGYAVQWFGLALALLVIYVVTNLRRVPGAGRAA
jgi:surfeit locus 1 family protein